jgi:putative transposase
MGTEITLRKRAIKLWLQGLSKSAIARRLGKPRLWVQRWIQRYDPRLGEASLQDRSSIPKHVREKYPKKVKEAALRSRREREERKDPKYKHALVGAEAIYYELQELGITPLPPPRTIHAWLKQADRIPKRKGKAKKPSNPTYPVFRCRAVNDIQELDLKGPLYLQGSSQKYYLVTLRDVYSKKVAIQALSSKKMEAMIDFLVASWRKIGCPKRLQMDNGLEFRGSNRYPRTLGSLLKVCLDLGVEPVFIPTHEPWRNGVIENFNGLLDRLFLNIQHFDTFQQFQTGVQRLETAINTTHRLPALNGKTPQEFCANAHVRQVLADYNWRTRDFRLLKGNVSYIRLVRKSGRITLTANDKFLIGKTYKWQYVLAQVDVRTHRLNVYLQNKLIKSFQYS